MTGVEIEQGRLRGTVVAGADAFLGIPYAADPAGERRFAAPAPHPGWTGVRDAVVPGPAAPQAVSRLAAVMGHPRSTGYDEAGCLTVNVWTPADRAPGDRLPVLFWLHGGAFITGSASWDWYSGARLAAEHRIVVVTANYRLGPLGYLYSPQLGPGNTGLLDQQAALAWTATNVAAFGGDPAAITVGGQSAGGISAALLAGIPATRDIVRRVVLQSGVPAFPLIPPSSAEETTDRLVHVLGRSRPTELRDVAADDLIAAVRELRPAPDRSATPLPPLGPVRTDDHPWADPAAALRDSNGELAALIGYTAAEGNAFLLAADIPDAAAALDRVSVDGAGGAALAAYYGAHRAGAAPWMLLADAATDQTFRRPALAVAEDLARSGRPVHVYQFDWSAELGAAHCIELPFQFGTWESWADAPMLGPAGTRDQAELDGVAAQFAGAIGAFVTSGDPAHAGLPAWPAYERERAAIMHIGRTSALAEPPVFPAELG